MIVENQMKKCGTQALGGDSCERSERYDDTKRFRALLDHNDVAGIDGPGDPEVEVSN
jgi:hypothetical protein